MYKRLFVILMMILPAGMATALPLKKALKSLHVKHVLTADTMQVAPRKFDAAAINKYKIDPAFKYVEEKAGLTWWDRFWLAVWHLWDSFWEWVGSILQKIFGGVNLGRHAASVFKYIILGLAAVMLVYVIFKLAGINLLRLFKKNKTNNEVPYTESIENIHEINFDGAIENALDIKNYRLAVRLLYLRSLKQLSDGNLIAWKIDKTNNAYLNELTNADYRQTFSALTRQFEYIWYGGFPVDGELFQRINAAFQEFKQRLS